MKEATGLLETAHREVRGATVRRARLARTHSRIAPEATARLSVLIDPVAQTAGHPPDVLEDLGGLPEIAAVSSRRSAVHEARKVGHKTNVVWSSRIIY
jgi:hypothetical protein